MAKSKFYNKKHQCGTQENGSTYSYVFMDVALQQGWRFVAKNTAEAVKASQGTSYTGADLVWIPAETTLVPHKPGHKQNCTHKRELVQEGHSSEATFPRQVWFSVILP